MPALDTAMIVLGGIALFAAFVNGAIGYGFSSLTVPEGARADLLGRVDAEFLSSNLR